MVRCRSRLAFDRRGYLYISIGGKNVYGKLHDLNTPFGKIHRVRDDGTVPKDNPFWVAPEERPEASTMHTVWSYGHRTGQGLDGHPSNGEIWNTEMGPRGGDEINHILKGQNYGWPLYTNGLAYNGKEVSIGKDLGLGSKKLCEKYGHPEFSMAVKGQEFPGYDPRALKGMSLAYATSNRGPNLHSSADR